MQTLSYIGASTAAVSSPTYSTTNIVSNGDSLTTAIGKIDTAAARKASTETISGAWTFSNDVIIASTKKLYLDGGGDTYVRESSANIVIFTVGGVDCLKIDQTLTGIHIPIVGWNLWLANGSSVNFHSTGHTYITGYEDGINSYLELAVDLVSAVVIYKDRVELDAACDLVIASTKKLRLDGSSTGDTYITEAAANTVRLIANSRTILQYFGGAAVANDYISIQATSRFYLDGGGDTYIYESAANVLNFYVGGSQTLQLQNNGTFLANFYCDAGVSATKKLYLDGGGDTYIYESSANNIAFHAGGNNPLNIGSTSVAVSSIADLQIASTKKLYFDGGSDTYLYESTANNFRIYAGGVHRALFNDSSIFLGESTSTTYLQILTSTNNGFIMNAETNSASATVALFLEGQNAGAGTHTAIDFTAGIYDHYFRFAASAVDPTGGGGAAAGRIPINISGATKYIPYY